MSVMVEPRPSVFFLVVYREYVSGMQQKALASVSSLMRFLETEKDNERRGLGSVPFDVYYVDVEALEVAKYDVAQLQTLMAGPKRRRA